METIWIVAGVVIIGIIIALTFFLRAVNANPIAVAAGNIGAELAKTLAVINSMLASCSSSFFSPSCGIGLGLIGVVVLKIAAFFYRNRQSKMLQNAVQQTGEKVTDIVNEITNQTREDVAKIKEEYKSQGKEMNTKTEEYISTQLFKRKITKKVFDAIENNQTARNKKQLVDQQVQLNAEMTEKINTDYDSLSPEERRNSDNELNRIEPEPRPPIVE